MENNLDSVRGMVEEAETAQLVQDGILVIIGHVVCDDWGKGRALQGEGAALEQDLVLAGQELGCVDIATTGSLLKQSGLHALGNVVDSLLELLDHSLTLQSLDCERVSLGRGNDECNDSHGRVTGFELLVQAYFFD